MIAVKNLWIIISLFLLCHYSKAQDADNSTFLDKATEFTFFQNRDFSTTFKFVDPEKGTFGIDYQLNLQRELGSLRQDASFKNLRLNLNSKGLVTVAGDENPINSLISEINLSAFPLFNIPAKNIVSTDSWEDFIDDEDTDPSLINKSRELAEQVSSPFWLFLNIHGKHETTQDFDDYNFAFGSSVSITTSYLTSILDYPFGLLRVDGNNNPRQLDLSVGYDYVIGIDETNLIERGNGSDPLNELSNMNRLNLKAEWETGIFTRNDRLSFYLDSYHDLDSNEVINERNKNWNYFYMIKLDHVINFNSETRTQTKASIKYTQGALPPNFEQGYVLGAGFSLEFK